LHEAEELYNLTIKQLETITSSSQSSALLKKKNYGMITHMYGGIESLINSGIRVQILVMPLLSKSLREIINDAQVEISIGSVIKYCLQLSKGLMHLHKYGFCHRDIKPENLMLSDEDNLVLIDFGTCVRIGDRSAGGGGDVYYPFDVNRVAMNEAMDIFAMGCVVYEMLSGQQLFSVRSQNWKWKQIEMYFPLVRNYNVEQIKFVSGVPGELQQLIKEMLSPQPNGRPSMETIIQRLEAL